MHRSALVTHKNCLEKCSIRWGRRRRMGPSKRKEELMKGFEYDTGTMLIEVNREVLEWELVALEKFYRMYPDKPGLKFRNPVLMGVPPIRVLSVELR
jgi:hypothetical protein